MEEPGLDASILSGCQDCKHDYGASSKLAAAVQLNQATSSGGAFFRTGGVGPITTSYFFNNTATVDGGAIFDTQVRPQVPFPSHALASLLLLLAPWQFEGWGLAMACLCEPETGAAGFGLGSRSGIPNLPSQRQAALGSPDQDMCAVLPALRATSTS